MCSLLGDGVRACNERLHAAYLARNCQMRPLPATALPKVPESRCVIWGESALAWEKGVENIYGNLPNGGVRLVLGGARVA
jgi:hypothetical protein